MAVRAVKKVTIWGRNIENARARAAEIAMDPANPLVEVFESAKEVR